MGPDVAQRGSAAASLYCARQTDILALSLSPPPFLLAAGPWFIPQAGLILNLLCS